MKPIIFPVKRVYFDEIREGEKTREFRLRTPFWEKRLSGRSYSSVVITLGYPAASDLSRRMVFPWSGFDEMTITHPHFGADPVDVFAIVLRDRIS